MGEVFVRFTCLVQENSVGIKLIFLKKIRERERYLTSFPCCIFLRMSCLIVSQLSTLLALSTTNHVIENQRDTTPPKRL